MNQTQRLVLVTVIVAIVAMLAWPPFQAVARNGVVYNLGYGWLFSPPKLGAQNISTATVNTQMLLIQWVGALVVGGLGFLLAKSPPAIPTGVGGWLLLLVARMMVLGPLLGAGGAYLEFWRAEYQFPALASFDEWRTFKIAFMCGALAVASFTVYGGWGLARGSDRSVVKRAIIILWMTGPAAVLILGVALWRFFGESPLDEEFILLLIAAIFDAAIWTAYLLRSKRVRNTYGQPSPRRSD